MSILRPAAFHVETTTFEGPLDLLVHLAQEGEVDLQTLSLSEIAEAFLTHSRHAFDVDEVTETLWMLSTLVELKARGLLPHPPQETAEPGEPLDDAGDLEALLEERLQEYRAFKDAATALRALEAYQERVFLRPPEEGTEPVPGDVSLDDLFRVFQEVLARRTEGVQEIPPEGISIADCMAAVRALLSEASAGVQFDRLFPPEATRLEVVVTFLAVLELIRLRRARVARDDVSGDLRIFAVAARRPG